MSHVTHADVADIYKLTPIQQGMLFHSLYAPDSNVYFEQFSWVLPTDLHVPTFERAWQYVVAQHALLRTAFFWEDLDEPLQVVRRQARLPFTALDWSTLTTEAQQAQLSSYLQADRQQPFDLAQAPLMRVTVIRVSPSAFTIVWSYHHLLLDGWSVPLVLHDVFLVYSALVEGRTPRLSRRRPYRDYLNWLHAQDMAAAERYWLQQLQGFDAPTPLPLERLPGRTTADDQVAMLQITLSPEATAELQALARQRHLTINTLVQGAWALLLYHYSGRRDLVFGVTVSGRPSDLAGSETIVGCLINTLPARIHIPAAATLHDWLHTLQQQQAELRQYEYSPLVQIQRWSEIPRGQPLFESLVVVENYPAEWFSQSSESGIHQQTNYPLTIVAVPQTTLRLRIGYDPGRFTAAAIDQLLAQLRYVLASMADWLDQPVATVDVLTPAERERLLVMGNANPQPLPQDQGLPGLFDAQAQRSPDAVAVICGERQISYATLAQRTNQLAWYLRQRAVGAGALVGLCLEPSIELIVAILAILKTGAAYVPIDVSYPEERRRFLLQDAQAAWLLTQPGGKTFVVPASVNVLDLDQIAPVLAELPTTPPPHRANSNDLAYVIYTSGSSGQPKGVACTHRGVINVLADMQRRQPLGIGDRASLWTSISFDVSVYELFSALTTGATVAIPPQAARATSQSFLVWLHRQQITSAYLPPFMLPDLAAWPNESKSLALRRMLVGVEPIPEPLPTTIAAQMPKLRIINGYGPTETSICATLYTVSSQEAPQRSTPIGRPVQNTSVYVLDTLLRPTPPGAIGELYIGGAGLAHGYWRRPALTAQQFIPDPFRVIPGARLYRTGDLVRWLPDGNLEFVGRADRQVKLRGFRIELDEIEHVLAQQPGVAQVAVMLHTSAQRHKQLVAYIVPANPHAPPSSTQLHTELATLLPHYMLPSAWIYLAALPLTANGKVERRALPAPEITPALEAFVAPRTPIEQRLAEIWQGVLDLERVGIHDNFFALGGDSILTIQIVVRARQAGLNLTPKQIFQHPTIAELATVVAAAVPAPTEHTQIRTLLLHQPGANESSQLLATDRNVEAVYPLTPLQQGLLFHTLSAPGSGDYLVQMSFRLTGNLNVAAFEQAWQQVVACHAILRTAFLDARLSVPQQVVQRQVSLPFTILDWRDPPADDQCRDLDAWCAADRAVGFNLSTAPLLRVHLIQLHDTTWQCVWTHHHLLLDGWSLQLVLRDLFTCYFASLTDTAPRLEPSRPYADYLTWLQNQDLAAAEAYWRRTFTQGVTGIDAPTPLRIDRPAAGAAPSYAEQTTRLSTTTTQALQRLARQERLTVSTLFQAAWALLLSRYSSSSEVVFGSVVSGRPSELAGVEQMVGLFINTLPMRVHLPSAMTLRVWLARLQAQQTELRQYDALPHLHTWSDLPSGTPLFESIVVVENYPLIRLPVAAEEMLDAAQLRIELLPPAHQPHYPLSLLVIPESQLTLRCVFDRRRVSQTVATRLLSHLQIILDALLADLDQPVAQVSLLSPAERQRALYTWNATTVPEPTTPCVHDLFAAQAAQTPDAVALSFGDEQMTYAELNTRSNQLAHHLRSLGVGSEARVAICLDRSPELIVGLLGVLKVGGAYVPLDPSYPTERLGYMLQDAQASVLITAQQLVERLPNHMPQLVLLDTDWAQITRNPMDSPNKSVQPDNLAYVIYTSGSTGLPKGVMISHRSVGNLARAQIRRFGVQPTTRVLQFASLSFDASVSEICMALLAGATLCLSTHEPPTPGAAALDLLRDQAITLATLPPSLLALLSPADFPTLHTVITAGEPCSTQIVARWCEPVRDNERRFFNAYGPTETTVCATIAECRDDGHQPPIGQAINNTQVYLLDQYLQPQPVGIVGELYIGGLGLARGYLNQPALTAERFVPDPFGNTPGARLYRTGDLARYRGDGQIEFVGRRDQQVKLRGLRVELSEIEAILGRHPALVEAAVIVREDMGDPRLVAYVVENLERRTKNLGVEEQRNKEQTRVMIPPSPATAGEGGQGDEGLLTSRGEGLVSRLRAFLAQRLPAYMVPSAFVVLDALPLTPHGKIDRRQLQALHPARPARNSRFVAPRTEIEQTIARIWSRVLELEHVGIYDNFFDLGGHSLLVVQIHAELCRAFDRPISLVELFRHPTISLLAKYFSQADVPQRRVERSNQTDQHTQQRIEALNRKPRHKRGERHP